MVRNGPCLCAPAAQVRADRARPSPDFGLIRMIGCPHGTDGSVGPARPGGELSLLTELTDVDLPQVEHEEAEQRETQQQADLTGQRDDERDDRRDREKAQLDAEPGFQD
jgi:hypothetical protein